MIDDFDAVLPPAADQDADDEARSGIPAPRDSEEDAAWRSDFRSHLEDPL